MRLAFQLFPAMLLTSALGLLRSMRIPGRYVGLTEAGHLQKQRSSYRRGADDGEHSTDPLYIAKFHVRDQSNVAGVGPT